MRKLIFFSLTATIFLLMGCSQPANVETMLKDSETRDKVFATIIEDHEMMTTFTDKMMANEHAMMMMKGNQNMMGMMMDEGDMMKMMQDKPEVMQNMMKDGKVMGQMMQMMQQGGMMSEECMQSTVQMMKDKGISMEMGMMNH